MLLIAGFSIDGEGRPLAVGFDMPLDGTTSGHGVRMLDVRSDDVRAQPGAFLFEQANAFTVRFVFVGF